MVERVEALENAVIALRAEIEALKQERHAPPTRVLRPSPAPYTVAPGGQVTARSFAERHKVSRDRMESLIKAGHVETTTVPYHDSVQHQLNRDQQRAVLAYWQEHHIPYTPCPECPHETPDQ